MGKPRNGPGDDAEKLRRAGLSVWRGKVEARIERAEAALERAGEIDDPDATAAAEILGERVTWARTLAQFEEGPRVVSADYPQVVRELDKATAKLTELLGNGAS